jgi:hypothetical protein
MPRIETTDIITNILKTKSGISENRQKEIIYIPKPIMGQNLFSVLHPVMYVSTT